MARGITGVIGFVVVLALVARLLPGSFGRHVHAYLPSFDREDFLITVFRGEEISNYTDSSGAMEDMDDEE